MKLNAIDKMAASIESEWFWLRFIGFTQKETFVSCSFSQFESFIESVEINWASRKRVRRKNDNANYKFKCGKFSALHFVQIDFSKSNFMAPRKKTQQMSIVHGKTTNRIDKVLKISYGKPLEWFRNIRGDSFSLLLIVWHVELPLRNEKRRVICKNQSVFISAL